MSDKRAIHIEEYMIIVMVAGRSTPIEANITRLWHSSNIVNFPFSQCNEKRIGTVRSIRVCGMLSGKGGSGSARMITAKTSSSRSA